MARLSDFLRAPGERPLMSPVDFQTRAVKNEGMKKNESLRSYDTGGIGG